jgi:quercetin dioxygenase-like cupin family protein
MNFSDCGKRSFVGSILVVMSLIMVGTPDTGLGHQNTQARIPVRCRPVSERTGELGCWILKSRALGRLAESTVFWHLDTYPTRADAEAAQGPHGDVIEALGKVWLFTVEAAGWRPASGVRVAEIGPLPVKAGEEHTVQYMESIGDNTMRTGAHYHPGPEVFYTTAGELCFEMPHGKLIGHAGEGTIMEPGHMHTLTALGTEQRRSVAMVVHESSQPWSVPASGWTPRGLCK